MYLEQLFDLFDSQHFTLLAEEVFSVDRCNFNKINLMCARVCTFYMQPECHLCISEALKVHADLCWKLKSLTVIRFTE